VCRKVTRAPTGGVSSGSVMLRASGFSYTDTRFSRQLAKGRSIVTQIISVVKFLKLEVMRGGGFGGKQLTHASFSLVLASNWADR